MYACACAFCLLLSKSMCCLKLSNFHSLISSNTVATDRTIQTKEHEDYARALSATRHQHQPSWNEEEHPGCQLSGFLLVDRAPGNFHIQAQSRGHDLAAHMTNVSHIINHLSFGKPFSNYFIKRGLQNTPAGFLETTRPFDGNVCGFFMRFGFLIVIFSFEAGCWFSIVSWRREIWRHAFLRTSTKVWNARFAVPSW